MTGKLHSIVFILLIGALVFAGGTAFTTEKGSWSPARDNQESELLDPSHVGQSQDESAFDYGDLPESYQTTIASNGAYHRIGSLFLGARIDGEQDGQPGDLALGDDIHGVVNDEDGIRLDTQGIWSPGDVVLITAVITSTDASTNAGGYLAAWIDWNGDGAFEGEQELIQFGDQTPGEHQLEITVPDTYSSGQPLNARFRLFTSAPADLSPQGQADNGEVEDYHWTFNPTAITLETFTAQSNHEMARTVFLIATFLLILVYMSALNQFYTWSNHSLN